MAASLHTPMGFGWGWALQASLVGAAAAKGVGMDAGYSGRPADRRPWALVAGSAAAPSTQRSAFS